MKKEILDCEGLREEVEIFLDKWGVPHIYANNAHDLYFAQGLVSARMRLWQMDLWRKRGLGLLSKSFGPSFLEQDYARRLFLYRGSMDDEWAAYGNGVREIMEAFVAGINSWVETTRQTPELIPSEFQMTSDGPALWKAEDIVRIRSVGLRMNLADELARCQLAKLGALDHDDLRRFRDPPTPLAIPTGLDPHDIPSDALRLYNLALADLNLSALEADVSLGLDATRAGASNVWAIGPSRTSTGRTIFANDPHRTHIVPSLRWLVHLHAPGIHAAGATEPIHPGVANGHNEHLAFGFTYSACDQEDLYVYELDPDDPTRYRYHDDWESLIEVNEAFEVAGEVPRQIPMRFTRHGPVLAFDEKKNRCIAVRSAFLQPGGSPYTSGIRYHRAESLDAFEDSLRNAVAPTMNYCGADTQGNIGLFVRGSVPVRKEWDGLMPVPGDGNYEWRGFIEPDEMPTDRNPSKGWVASCNQIQLPESYPYGIRRIGFEYPEAMRYRRLTSLIESSGSVSMGDACRFQNDQTLEEAGTLISRLLAGDGAQALPASLCRALADWEGHMSVGSSAAAFYAVWTEAHLRPRLVSDQASSSSIRAVVGVGDWRGLLNNGVADHVLVETAFQALEDLNQRLGTDTDQWRLGDVQKMSIVHPLASSATNDLGIGPLPLGGHSNTLNKAESFLPDLQVRHGASFRIVLDVGDWDQALAINMPGQAGDPHHKHYRDMVHQWHEGSYVPLLWSRDRIQAESEMLLNLLPKRC